MSALCQKQTLRGAEKFLYSITLSVREGTEAGRHDVGGAALLGGIMTDIAIANGSIKLAASVYGVDKSDPILFLHGISLSRDTWEEIASQMSSQCSVWTLDFRGHGNSDPASSYQLADYVSDAEATLAAIGRPAILVGHSLGGVVAGVLAQGQHPNVRAVLLEDPSWYMGIPGEWERTPFPTMFATFSAKQAAWQKENAPLATYLSFLSNSPSLMGGITSDHISPRHLLSHASALQRQDNRCWENPHPSLLAGVKTDREFRCPTKVVQADPQCGAILLDDQLSRLTMTNPKAEIAQYRNCGHSIHRMRAFEQRFLGDIQAFVSKIISESAGKAG
jgi:pimeloyl-ACP methyl ester carboxylesterase